MPQGAPRVVITDDGYEPRDLEIRVGERVTFVNRGTVPHSAKDESGGDIDVSPQPGSTAHDGSEINRASHKGFASHALFPDEPQAIVFPVVRKYEFYCAFHADMRGTLTVVDGS